MCHGLVCIYLGMMEFAQVLEFSAAHSDRTFGLCAFLRLQRELTRDIPNQRPRRGDVSASCDTLWHATGQAVFRLRRGAKAANGQCLQMAPRASFEILFAFLYGCLEALQSQSLSVSLSWVNSTPPAEDSSVAPNSLSESAWNVKVKMSPRCLAKL